MENECTCPVPDSFGVQVAKSFILSGAMTAGFVAGLVFLGGVKAYIDDRREVKQQEEPS